MVTWVNSKNTSDTTIHYSVWRGQNEPISVTDLLMLFDNGEPDEMNFVLFSTSGVHGTYCTIEQAEEYRRNGELDESYVTFLVVRPRTVVLMYGNVALKADDDFDVLKQLRDKSQQIVCQIGWPSLPKIEENMKPFVFAPEDVETYLDDRDRRTLIRIAEQIEMKRLKQTDSKNELCSSAK